MGIGAILGGLANVAGTAAPFVANTLAAKQQAQAQGAMQSQQQMLKLLALQMEQQRQSQLNALSRAQVGYYGARQNALEHPLPKLVNGPDGLYLENPGDPLHPTAVGARKASAPVVGSPEWLDAQDKLAKVKSKYRAPTYPTIAVMPGTNGVAQGVETHGPEVGKTIALPDVNRAATGAAGGASRVGAMAPVPDMVQRYGEIAQHAQDLAAGKWKITRAMQIREGLEYAIAREGAGGEKVPVGQSIAAAGMDAVGAGLGPDYARYQALMNSTRALGDDVAKVFKGRQNEEAVLREVALAELTPGDYGNAAVVQQKLSRLRHVISLARATQPMAEDDAVPAPSPASKAPATPKAPKASSSGDYGIFGGAP